MTDCSECPLGAGLRNQIEKIEQQKCLLIDAIAGASQLHEDIQTNPLGVAFELVTNADSVLSRRAEQGKPRLASYLASNPDITKKYYKLSDRIDGMVDSKRERLDRIAVACNGPELHSRYRWFGKQVLRCQSKGWRGRLSRVFGVQYP